MAVSRRRVNHHRPRWQWAALVLVTLLVGCEAGGPRPGPVPDRQAMRVMSANLLLSNHNTQPLIDEIREVDPDVLMVQEYTPHWHEALSAAFGGAYPHAVCEPRPDPWGMAVYSRHPFLSEPQTRLPLGGASTPQIRVVIDLAGEPVAFYNIHMMSQTDRLDWFIEHHIQFSDLLEVLSAEPLPTVVAGDFNYGQHTLSNLAMRLHGQYEVHDLAGQGDPKTWPVKWIFRSLPGLRLDHMYVGGGLSCRASWTGRGKGSDHRPIIAEVGFTDEVLEERALARKNGHLPTPQLSDPTAGR